MAAKVTEYANSLLKLVFNAIPYSNIADNASSLPLTNLYVSLHTSSPGASGNQATNEATYTSYARVAVPRLTTNWIVVDNSVLPASTISFPAAIGGSETVTHFGIGTSSSGSGNLLYFGTTNPNIVVSAGVTPQLTTSSAIIEN